jgi:hypothetical protein
MRVARFFAIHTGLLSLLVLGTAASVSAQSLGDVAKKEEERRKQTPTGKVYTNKDLGAVPPSSAPPPPPAAEGEKGAAPDAAAKDGKSAKDGKDNKDEKAKGDAKDQAYWAGRRKQLQDALDRDSTLQAAMQSRINSLTTDFVNRDDPIQRSAIERDRQKAVAEQARLKKQVDDDRKAIADLEEEARRAGVPPGWLR